MCRKKLKFENTINNVNLKDVCGKLFNSSIYFDSSMLSFNNQL